MRPSTEPSDEGSLAGRRLYNLAWAFYLLLALGAVVWLGWQHELLPLSVFLDPGSWWIDLAVGIASGAVLLGAWQMGGRWFPETRQLEARLRELIGPLEAHEAVGLAVLSGVAEEVFFRGAVQGAWGWVPATLLFAALHGGPDRTFRLWTVFAAVAGLLFAGVTLWRGNLLAAVVAHVVVNAVNLRRLTDPRLAEIEAAPAGE